MCDMQYYHHVGPRHFLGRGWRHAPGCVGYGCGYGCRSYFDDAPVEEADLKAYIQELEMEIEAVKKSLGERPAKRGASK